MHHILYYITVGTFWTVGRIKEKRYLALKYVNDTIGKYILSADKKKQIYVVAFFLILNVHNKFIWKGK